jgi:hypothetical protein
LLKFGIFGAKIVDCPCFIFQGYFQKYILLTNSGKKFKKKRKNENKKKNKNKPLSMLKGRR